SCPRSLRNSQRGNGDSLLKRGVRSMFDDYVSVDSTPLYRGSSGSGKSCHLLWGDGVRFAGSAGTGSRRRVTARGGRFGFVSKSALGGASLLEFYFIDVGQGDGILIKTPKFRHVMIDGGFPRSVQDTGKNAADFVDWKFFKDYGKNTIELDAMLASHCDADHYGGLDDLLDVSQKHELDAASISVEAFFHAGLSWWKNASGGFLGESAILDGEKFWTRLLGDRSHAAAVTGDGGGDKLHGWWHDFIERVVSAKTRSGQPTSIKRLSHVDEFVPGFGPNGDGEPTIRILGPIEFDHGGKPALRRFSGGDSQNTNGVSLLLRVDYGRTRVLLTGDLNKASQQTLLDDYLGERVEFHCDVAKACHHGSEDVSYKFLQAMQPAATIISSGDNEGHDHPRPAIIAASATTGYLQLDNHDDDLLTPLVYSTELGRSIDLGFPKKLEEKDPSGAVTETLTGQALARATLHITKAKRKTVRLGSTMVVGGLIYGLVNVRTDGDKILCATLDEKDGDWRIKTFRSRF
ncbi:MAG: ComEC/Rec2 family competence protein, partial [Candidatus Binatia bacterium]